MNPGALAADLDAMGIDCEIEGRERLAIVRPRGTVAALADAVVRAAVVRAARLRGFTHVALEIGVADDAPVSLD